ncbi:hypothetical protein PF005_g28186 [Phytophthora fragariae]|uniref:Secreted protein n=1 Tax=Phytophthora fragariae TaxID=53985 RepID=A0A6A3HI18_9STRA|nr:hypothetical protein PF003_g9035 [Phytophthora fragariae]KAE8920988.1 hypothetical protein PF009_g28725 [Phytophthora fragariae]KAE8968425.1 hypothetical protein PF011_g27187 [Phytophthora fragariae]KAE9067245.1 hypothetical protein PF007_g28147 [Phytophthora fragariae]KAE9073112.1 hypothetical protein PF010_g25212 [Phytophthora fragariae]
MCSFICCCTRLAALTRCARASPTRGVKPSSYCGTFSSGLAHLSVSIGVPSPRCNTRLQLPS